MMPPNSMTRPLVTRVALEQRGFSPQQIARLEALATAYPLLEFLDSRAEWQRLTFLKWRYLTGRIPQD